MGGQRRMVLAVLAAVASTIALGVVGVSPAAAAVVCGQSITTDTTLTTDLSCPSGSALFVTVSDVSVDLNGHTISGTQPDGFFFAGVAVSSGRTGVRISGGTVRGFTHGVVLNPDADGAWVTNMTLDGNGLGIGGFTNPAGGAPHGARIMSNVITNTTRFSGMQLAGGGHIVQANTVADGAGAGILLIGSDNLVTSNKISNSGSNGLVISTSPNDPGPFVHNQLLGNRVTGSGRLFNSSSISIRAAVGTVVTGNTVIGRPIAPALLIENSADTRAQGNQLSEAGSGVLVRGTSSNTTLLQNRIDHNTTGMQVQSPATGTLLDRNVVNDNQFDGINVSTSAATVKGNTAYRNGSLGIRAVAGVIDGGANRAFSNGTPAQCTPNIAC